MSGETADNKALRQQAHAPKHHKHKSSVVPVVKLPPVFNGTERRVKG